MKPYTLFFPLILVVVLAAPVAASGDSGVERVSYFHVVMDENGTILLGVEDAVLIDSGYDAVPGYTYKFALKGHAWRDYLFGVRTNFYGAGVRVGPVLVGIVAERPWYQVGIDIYLKVWWNDQVQYEKKLGHFGLTDTDKTWTVHVEVSMDCQRNVKVRITDEYGYRFHEEQFLSAAGAEDVYWVPWDQDNEAGVYVLQTQQFQDCGATGGNPITTTGPVSNPLDTSDKDGYNPLTDWKFLLGLGAVLVGLGLLIPRR